MGSKAWFIILKEKTQNSPYGQSKARDIMFTKGSVAGFSKALAGLHDFEMQPR